MRDKALLDMQRIDSEIDALRRELVAIPEREVLRETETKLKSVCGERADEAARFIDMEHAQKKLEDESSRLDAKITGEERKLYAGSIGNPKELMALQHEIKVLNSEKDDIDTMFLVGEDSLQECKVKLAALTAQEEDLGKTRKELEKTVQDKVKDMEERISKLETDRIEPLNQLDELSLRVYEQMRVKGHGIAVVEVHDGICGGCHLENSEDSGHGAIDGPVRRCEYCHRILITS